MDTWDPETELEEIRKLINPLSNGIKEEILIFDLRKIDPLRDFENPELKAGFLLLKIIRDPWDDFIVGWKKIREILNSMGKQKTMTFYERALEEVREEGREEGKTEKALETALKMQDERFNPEQIARITGLSEDQLKKNGIL